MDMNEHIAHEQKRLAALDRYDILDTPTEEAFDRVVRLTRRMFDVPMSTVTFVDGHRQWFKAREGVADCETERGPAFCNVVVREDHPLVVLDTLADERFKTNPFVTGAPHLRFYAGVPLHSPDGYSVGTLCAMDTRPREFAPRDLETLSDLAQVVVSELELRLLATTDGLTGALMRRAFHQEGERAVSLAVRHRHSLSCIVFDLDHFKRINDAHGHAVGDRVLRETVATVRGQLRKSDLVGRIGGEEFAVVLAHTGRTAAMDVADKLRSAIARQRIHGASAIVDTTASFGVAALDGTVQSFDALLQRADTALYAAKADGRNRCQAWHAVDDVPVGVLRRVLKAGRITFNAGRSTIDCTVRGLSDSGASLAVNSAAGVPESFKLQIESDGLARACRIVAKTSKNLEVEFQ